MLVLSPVWYRMQSLEWSVLDQRFEELASWLKKDLGKVVDKIEPASGDASFRRYFRVTEGDDTEVVMDAPPTREDVHPFIAIADQMRAVGLNVPEVRARNLEQGYLLLSDLGHRQYLPELNDQTVDALYQDALDALLILQSKFPADSGLLPSYDHKLLMFEMSLFKDWFLERHLGVALAEDESHALEQAFELLAQSALVQPRVAVHRDYHSRNLMIVPAQNPGILDFQDAVAGPITYDLVSLLRDCYIAWPRERVETWALGYRDQALKAGLIADEHADSALWLRWFDLMGVQRHLKAIGIFARLNHRDGKPGYLGDIPRTLGYIVEVAARYPELAGLGALIDSQVINQVAPEFAS